MFGEGLVRTGFDSTGFDGTAGFFLALEDILVGRGMPDGREETEPSSEMLRRFPPALLEVILSR